MWLRRNTTIIFYAYMRVITVTFKHDNILHTVIILCSVVHGPNKSKYFANQAYTLNKFPKISTWAKCVSNNIGVHIYNYLPDTYFQFSLFTLPNDCLCIK